MVNVWVAIAGIASALIAAIGAVLIGQKAEDRRWLASQVHLANVARADRLRGAYGQMAQASLALRLVIGERGFLFDGETEEEENDRHNKQIREALGRVGDMGGQILVESSAEKSSRRLYVGRHGH